MQQNWSKIQREMQKKNKKKLKVDPKNKVVLVDKDKTTTCLGLTADLRRSPMYGHRITCSTHDIASIL